MTKRTEQKELFLAALRGDAAAQRKCTSAGKPCGGRCIPKSWNCRIKGEGETPPTRGNAVQLSAEQKERVIKARNSRRRRRALTALAGATAVGAAVAGAAALGAKNPAMALNLKRKTGGLSKGLGVASVIGGPKAAAAAGVANMAVGGFDVGAGVGMAFARRKRDLGAFKRLTKQRFRLEKQLKPLEAARNRSQSTLRKAQERLSTETTRLTAAQAAMKNKGQRRSGFALGQNPQSIAQTDRARKTNLKSAETAFRRANTAVNKAEAAFKTRETAYQSALKQLNTTTTRASKLRSKLLESKNPIQNAYESGMSGATRSFRAGRRTVSSFFRTPGVKGPKADPRSWQERLGLDEAEREDKKCGNSGIPDNAKCTKKNTARTIAKAAAATALVVGGVVALKNRSKIRSKFRKTGLTPYQKEQLKKMRAKGTGKYGAQGKRSFTSEQKPFYSEADRIYPVKHKRLFRDAESQREDKKCGKSGIPDNAKCTKGVVQGKAAEPKKRGLLSRAARRLTGASKRERIAKYEKEQAAREKKYGKHSPDANGGEAVAPDGPLGRLLKKKGIDPNKIGGNSDLATELAGQMEQFGKSPVPEKNFRFKSGTKIPKLPAQYLLKKDSVEAEERDDVIFTNKELHARVKAEAKRKFKVYPSAYANAWMVKEYKKRGGGFRNDDLKKWFNEKWVRMSAKGEILGPCGDRSKGEGKPRCLPEAKARALSKKERAKTVRAKRKADPKKNRAGKAKMVPNTFDEEGKKFSKTVTNPETGRKKTVKYGAKGYSIAPGTKKGDRYCARSFGDMKSHNKNCAGKDRNTPLCLSRAKWKCSGKSSRRS